MLSRSFSIVKNEFTDQWGTHRHEVSQPGRPYNPNLSITCPSCINRLDTVMNAWLTKLTKRNNLPDNFWDSYKFPWSK